ncbi:MAG: AAA family ATPase [Lachnospiraceae bacterium]|nr:AAA family ATPase [Lachnospiraceae bacterium]
MEMNGLSRLITEKLYRLDMEKLCAEKCSTETCGGPGYRIAYFISRVRLLNIRAADPAGDETEILFSTKEKALRELTGGTKEACSMFVRTIRENELAAFKGLELHIAGSYITPDAEEEKPYALIKNYWPADPSADADITAFPILTGLDADLDDDCLWDPFSDEDAEEETEEGVLFFGSVISLRDGMYTCAGKDGVVQRFPCNEKTAGYAAGNKAGIFYAGTVSLLPKAHSEAFRRIGARYSGPELSALYSRFLKENAETQEQLIEDMQRESDPEADSNVTGVLRMTDENSLSLKFSLTEHTLPMETRRAVREILSGRDRRPFRNMKESDRERLKYLLNISPVRRGSRRFDPELMKQQLDQKITGLEDIKQLLCSTFDAEYNHRKNRQCTSFLLVGPMGTGKTLVGECAAQNMNVPFISMACAGISSALAFVGDEVLYDKSAPGEIVRRMYQEGTSEVVLFLNEIDKMGRSSKDGDPYMALLDMLADSKHYDRYLETYIDTSRTCVIATANSREKIPDVLLNRFTHIIEFPAYTNEDKARIGRTKADGLLRDYGITGVRFSDEALDRIAGYTDDDGMRSYMANLKKVVTSILTEKIRVGTITAEYIDSHLSDDAFDPVKVIFKRNENSYPEPVRREIRLVMARLENRDGLDAETITKLHEKLELLVRLQARPAGENFDIRQVRDKLDATHYGMNDVKKQIARTLLANMLSGSVSDTRILLSGPAGIGKTSAAASIADALDRPLVRISCESLERGSSVKGFSFTYRDAGPGQLLRGICRAGTTNCVVLLDELEKCSQEAMQAFLSALDSSSLFIDQFLGVGIDLSGVIFIATCNDPGRIPGPLRNRFREIRLQDYTPEEKAVIAEQYILPRLLKKYRCEKGQVLFEEGTVQLLAGRLGGEPGMRRIERELDNLILDALMEQPGGREPVRIRETIVHEFLKKNMPEARPKRRIGF